MCMIVPVRENLKIKIKLNLMIIIYYIARVK